MTDFWKRRDEVQELLSKGGLGAAEIIRLQEEVVKLTKMLGPAPPPLQPGVEGLIRHVDWLVREATRKESPRLAEVRDLAAGLRVQLSGAETRLAELTALVLPRPTV